jgi:hypothetical protein
MRRPAVRVVCVCDPLLVRNPLLPFYRYELLLLQARPPSRRRWSPRAQLPNEKRKGGGGQLQYSSMWCRLTCYCYHTIDDQSVGGLLRSSLTFPSLGPHPILVF